MAVSAGRPIKTRYQIPIEESRLAEVDVYEGRLAPLVVVEVEFDSLEAVESFTPLGWFGDEVTHDTRYRNAELSVAGSPP